MPQQISMDVPAQTVGGRTMLPLRAVSKATGAEVEWNGETNTAIITTGATPTTQPTNVDGLLGEDHTNEQEAILGLIGDTNTTTVARPRSVTING